jgi:hypothetical protein
MITESIAAESKRNNWSTIDPMPREWAHRNAGLRRLPNRRSNRADTVAGVSPPQYRKIDSEIAVLRRAPTMKRQIGELIGTMARFHVP